MNAREVIERMTATPGRGAGTDAERRVAAWLAEGLRAEGHDVAVETVWIRPGWAVSHALSLFVAAAGTALSAVVPAAGVALTVLALLSLGGELSGELLLARRLTRRRASQNVVVHGPRSPAAHSHPSGRLRLLLVANVDAGRMGAAYRDVWVRAEAGLRRRFAGRLPSPLGLATLTVALQAALAATRLAGTSGQTLGIAQLALAMLALLGAMVLIDIALSPHARGAVANASGVATAIEVLEALRRSPPEAIDVDVVLAGAGDSQESGFSALLADRRRRGWRPEEVVVIALEPCAVGELRYLSHQGQLLARALHPQLIAAVHQTGAQEAHLAARPLRDHGAGAAHAARRAGWPAIGIGARDRRDRPGPVRQRRDAPDVIDDHTRSACVELCLALIAVLDRDLARAQSPGLTVGGSPE